MKKLFIFFLLSLFLLACGDPAEPIKDASLNTDASDGDVSLHLGKAKIKVMTWNVKNFFDDKDDPEKDDDVLTRKKLANKIHQLGIVLRKHNADFIALQEVENKDLLTKLVNQELKGKGYKIWDLIEGHDPRGIDVAFISKFPVKNIYSHLGEQFEFEGVKFRYARDALEVILDIEGHSVDMMVVHFRSQVFSGTGDADQKRSAEAKYSHDILKRRISTGMEKFILLGDCNDDPNSQTIRLLVNDGIMENAALSIAEKDRWSVDFGKKLLYDYIMPSKILAKGIRSISIDHSAEVKRASDHAPLIMNVMIE